MYRLFIIFLLLFQSFFLCANSQNINYSIQRFGKHAEYISAQPVSQKRISIDFKSYENAFINANSKTQEIFEYRNSNNINGYFIGFANSYFKNNNAEPYVIKTSNSENKFSYFRLKNEICARAP